ncbi:glycosyltransferase family 2 protein [Dysgonomonas sp. HGC4]|uniref:glycosyltransferase family 2 protein n=1 Tax=Dysgonomonas sp. HGC4 TaxID=1658009 RepID=UPI0006808A5C|nr:glycosyltransferase family 2 protein [Dysgonomonas sp. HGC4]MBD8349064.1 glycosyltransferase [Dysgonomonas sp. HGC4]
MRNNNYPLVSIITITYNAIEVLEKTIESVINQSYPNVEYIIIDGGSTDGTVDTIQQYQDQISYWISEPDKGIYDAMNKGLKKASGEWVNFMNAGDYFYDSFVIDSVFSLDWYNYDIICGRKEGEKIDRRKATRWNLYKSMGICHQVIFSRLKFLKNGFNLEYKISADFDWLLKAYYNRARIKMVDIVVVIYQGGGISESNAILLQKEFYEILKVYYPRWSAELRRLVWCLRASINF